MASPEQSADHSIPAPPTAETLAYREVFGTVPIGFEALMAIIGRRLPELVDNGIQRANEISDNAELTTSQAYLRGLLDAAYTLTQPDQTLADIRGLEQLFSQNTPETTRE